jgi:hypothetical protein
LLKVYKKKKINSMLQINFCCGSSRILARSCNMYGRGGRAGSSYELDVAQNRHAKNVQGNVAWGAEI